MKSILIIGSAGFIGNYVTQSLLARGVKVCILDFPYSGPDRVGDQA